MIHIRQGNIYREDDANEGGKVEVNYVEVANIGSLGFGCRTTILVVNALNLLLIRDFMANCFPLNSN